MGEKWDSLFSFLLLSLSLSLSLWHNHRHKAAFSIDNSARARALLYLSRFNLLLLVVSFLSRDLVKSMIFGYLSRPGRFRAVYAHARAPVKLE